MAYQEVVIFHPGHSLEDFPTDLPDEKAAGLLNAFAAAWHPALLADVKELPVEHRADDPPAIVENRLFMVPPACDELVPADWIERARAEGGTVVCGITNRQELLDALIKSPLCTTIEPDLVADFLALGMCKLQLALLTRRMHHFGEMDEGQLQREVVAAAESAVAADTDAARSHLQTCFEMLTEARERFYPVECYLLDVCLLIPRLADAHLNSVLEGAKPVNVLATAADFEAILKERPDLHDVIARGVDGGTVELLGGEWHERPVPLLPLSSVLYEFETGHEASRKNFGHAPTTWARRRYGFATLVPQILHRLGYRGGFHVALDDGIYPDSEQSKIRWEGCDGSTIDATTRIPLAAESASSYLRFPSRMAESMQQDQTAAVIWARWPDVAAPFWKDFERIHAYSPVLGRFFTVTNFFERSEDPGRLSKFEEREYLSPFLIQAVAAEEDDPIGRFQQHFLRRARYDAGAMLDGLAAVLREAPVGSPDRLEMEAWVEQSGPDFPSDAGIFPSESDAQVDAFLSAAAGRLGGAIAPGSSGGPGYLVLNPLAFHRTVTVSLPRLEAPPAIQPPVRGAQFDKSRRDVTVDLPSLGYTWISAQSGRSERVKNPPVMAEPGMIRNEFIEVYINDATGGIGRIKQFGRRPNRLSQQLAFRFPRERTLPHGEGEENEPERTFYSIMRCSSISVTAKGPGLGEIVTTGTLVDPEDGASLAEYEQAVRVWRGRPMIELEIKLHPLRMPSGDPWSNYIASRFAWNDSAATITRSVLGAAHAFQLERFESPHFLEIATESQRTTIVTRGLCFHRKTGMRMIDSLLVVGGERVRHFKFGIAIDADYPMQPALELLVPPMVVETAGALPPERRSGWLFRVNSKNVQVMQLLPLKPPDIDGGDDAWRADTPPVSEQTYGFRLRLMETEGRHRTVELRSFRTPTLARLCDFRGWTISVPRIVDDAVVFEMTGYEIVDLELRFDELSQPVSS